MRALLRIRSFGGLEKAAGGPYRRRNAFAVLIGLLLIAGAVEFGRRITAVRSSKALSGPGSEYRILCIGSSTTLGQQEISYPAYLERILDERYGDQFMVINGGEVHLNEEDVAEKLVELLYRHQPRVVVTMIPEAMIGPPVSVRESWLEKSFASGPLSRRRLELTARLPKDPLDPAVNRRIEEVLNAAMTAFERGERSESAKILREGMRAHPQDARFPLLRAIMLARDGKQEQAELFVRWAKNLPQTAETYAYWGRYHGHPSHLAQRITALENALILDPSRVLALAEAYMEADDMARAGALLEEAFRGEPRSDVAGMLATLCLRQGRLKEAEKYYSIANELRRSAPDPVTRAVYAQIADVLGRRGIRFVCVQLPVRGIESLKMLVPPDSGAILVDNEKLFKDEIKRVGYAALFVDMAGGDFGHCTSRGYGLLAENVARAIERSDPGIGLKSGAAPAQAEAGQTPDEIKEEYYRRVVEVKKNDVAARRVLAELYERKRKWRKAEEHYRALLDIEPDNLAVRIRLAQVYETQKNWRQAEEQCLKVLKREPYNPVARAILPRIYEGQGQWGKAEQQLLENLYAKPNDPDARRPLAEFYMDRKEWQKAEEQFLQILKAEPESLGTLLGLAGLYQEQKRGKKAEELYQKALEVEPEHVGAMLRLAGLYEYQEQWEKAEEQYEKILRIEPEHVGALLRLAGLYEHRKQWKKAQEQYQKVLTIDAEHLGARQSLARLYERNEQWAKAEEQYEEVLRIEPRTMGALLGLAGIYEDRKQWGKAEEQFQKALRIEPERLGARQGLARLYERNEQWAKAEEQYEEILRIEPRTMGALLGLAEIYKDRKQWGKVEEQFQKVLRVDAEHLGARESLARLYSVQARWAAAEKEYREILKIRRGHPPALLDLSFCLLKAGRRAEAEEVLREARRSAPESFDARVLEQEKEKLSFFHDWLTKQR